jgi:hypothetical protein
MQLLSQVGIEVIGVSSDGDSRLLKAMRQKIELPKQDLNTPIKFRQWFFALYIPRLICVQDSIHIGGKLRMRLLNGKILIFGKYSFCNLIERY